MGKFSKVDIRGMKTLYQKMARLEKQNYDAFCRSAVKELAARLLSKVIPRTPVGKHKYKVTSVQNEDGSTARYKSGKRKGRIKQKREVIRVGGTLRRGWTSKTEKEAEGGNGNGTSVSQFLKEVQILKNGCEYEITIENPVHYAPYVEFGHKQTPGRYVPALGKRLKKSFVPGQHMLKISEDELRAQAPAILEKKLTKFLREVFSGDGK